MRRPGIRSLAGGAAGIAAGIIGGVVLTAVSVAGPAPLPSAPALIDATHVPPVLTIPGEPVRLRYALVCTPRDDGQPCDGSGTVYLREGQSGPFRPFALQRDDESRDGRYYLDVPPALAASAEGFSYYAVLRDDASDAAVSIPSGGADAPQLSLPLDDALAVSLEQHAFGALRSPDARAAAASWGSAPQDVGLVGTRELGFAGPSSFDVEPDGTVDLLDSVNGRVMRWAHGRHDVVPLDDGLQLADFTVEPDGSFDVLDARGTVRSFHPGGAPKWTQKVSDRTWAKLEHDRTGPVVLQQPSEEWMPVAAGGVPLTRSQQAHAAHVEKKLANGREVLVARVGENELRVGEVRGGRLVRGWRITSETPLGEVQLAESHGSRMVVVTRAYTEGRDEFVVLVLDRAGVAARFSVASDSWTETAPLARFRLVHGSLYRLHTTQAGAFVDRFDLEVPE